ncbi:MAG: hypothetical protein HRU35_07240, partial [Rickettsiaceae bacterium]|nr:hypothetical protein [Rickettsiaceae bacterium]
MKNSENYDKLKESRNVTLENACEVINKIEDRKQSDITNKNQQKLENIKDKIEQDVNKFAENLGNSIQLLNEMQDNKIGVVWHKPDKPHANGTKDLIRDARNVTKDIKELQKDSGEKYGMQILNSIRGAIDLLDDPNSKIDEENKAVAKKYFMKLANEVIDKALYEPDSLKKDIKGYNSKIVFALNDAGVGKSEKETTKMLQFAREAAGLKDEHYNISTLISQKDSWGQERTVIQSDVMLPSLTAKQQQEYKAIANVSSKRNLNNKDLLATLPKWFQKLKPHERSLMHAHAQNIADGKRVISSQFLTKLPGLRNAYEKNLSVVKDQREEDFLRIIAVDKNDLFQREDLGSNPKYDKLPEWFKKLDQGTQFEILDEAKEIGRNKEKRSVDFLKKLEDYSKDFVSKKSPGITKNDLKTKLSNLHCGTPATKIELGDKQAEIDIVKENLKQLQMFQRPGETINLNILNTNLGSEKFIFDQIMKATEELNAGEEKEQFTVTNSAINAARFFTSRQNEVFKDTLVIIGKNIENEKLSDVAIYLKEGKSSKSEALKQIEELAKTEPEYANDLKTAVEARELIDSSNTKFNKHKHANLELSAKMSYLLNAVRDDKRYISKGADKIIKHIVDFCKSGKDRTGINKAETDRNAIANALDVDPKSEVGKENLLLQASGNHEQSMAGTQGGMLGCHSLKDKSFKMIAFIRENKTIRKIFAQKSAHHNSKVKYHKIPSPKKLYRPIKYTYDLIKTSIKRYKLKKEYKNVKNEIKENIAKEKEQQKSLLKTDISSKEVDQNQKDVNKVLIKESRQSREQIEKNIKTRETREIANHKREESLNLIRKFSKKDLELLNECLLG